MSEPMRYAVLLCNSNGNDRTGEHATVRCAHTCSTATEAHRSATALAKEYGRGARKCDVFVAGVNRVLKLDSRLFRVDRNGMIKDVPLRLDAPAN